MFLFSRCGPPALTDKNYYAYFISILIIGVLRLIAIRPHCAA